MVALLRSYRNLAWILGGFLAILAGTMLIPLGFSLLTDQADLSAFATAAIITLASAAALLLVGRKRERRELRSREAILLVVLVWLGVCSFGGLPFYFSPAYTGFTDSVFEATSGFTTTGATVIADVDSLSRPIHLWRSLSHWLGGMGIVLLGLAVLPLLGQGGNALYRAEFSGSVAERLRPRLVETTRALWKIYLLLTVAEFGALALAGMSPFEALCHAFSTLGTGGFSTRTESLGAFDDPLIQYLVILFMVLAGISFVQHFRAWIEHDFQAVRRDYELKAYLALITLATLVIGVLLVVVDGRSLEPAVRSALFQVVSVVTTTGFATEDYGNWLPVAQLLLLLLMFTGGCTGSTAGGLKIARGVLVLRLISREFRRLAEPQGVFRVRVGNDAVPELALTGLLNLLFLAWLVLLFASLLVAATGSDILTSVSAVVACQFNIGPGLGAVGPAAHYGELAPFAKWVLSLCMIAGRLEFYTLLVLLTRAFWHR